MGNYKFIFYNAINVSHNVLIQSIYQWTNQSRNNEVYPQFDSYLCKVICALQNVPILNAKNTPKGTQLKLNLEIEGNNQVVIFKPSWYNRTRVIDGPSE